MHQTPLANLVHHAKLPFVGRDAQLAELHRCWQSGKHQQRLQVGLIVGEAGVGKSTLLNQFIRQFPEECTLAHTRFTPNSSTSLVRAISRSLDHAIGHTAASGHGVPRRPIAWRTPHDVAEGIPAIASATQLVLVLEDIHLLKEEGIQQLALLLRELRTVGLLVLCVTRPLPAGGMAALDGLIDTTIVLNGLQAGDIVALWHRLFAERPNHTVIDAIATATQGNPLVIRSGLLRALSNNAIQATMLPERVAVTVQLLPLQQSLMDSLRSISDAMTLHLPAPMLQCLRTLATLGEVFPIEAARLAVPNAETLIEELQQRGLVAVAPSVHTSLISAKTSVAPLLSFSHTMMHREILGQARPDTEMLLRVMAAELPIYSTLPFSLLAAATDLECFSKELLLKALQGIYSYTGAMFTSDDWVLAPPLLAAAEHLMQALDAIAPQDNDEALIEARILLVMLQMEHSSGLPDLPAYGQQLDRLQQLTTPPLPPGLAHYRLACKSALGRNIAFQQPTLLLETVEELFAAAQQWHQEHSGEPHPTGFKITLVALMVLGRRCRHYGVIHWTAQHLEAMLESLDLQNPVELEEYTETLPFVLLLRRSSAEFAKHVQWLTALEAVSPLSTALLSSKAHLLVVQGQASKGLEILKELLPKMRRHQLHVHRISAVGTLVLGLGMVGKPMETIIQQAQEELRDAPPDFSIMGALTAIATTLVFAFNIEQVSDVEKFFPEAQRQLNKKVLRYFAAAHHDAERIRQLEPPVPEPNDPYGVIADVFASAQLTPQLESEVVEKIEMEIIEATDLLQFRALLLAVEWMQEQDYPIHHRLMPAAQEGIRRWLEWLRQRELITFATRLVERFGAMLPPSELEQWEERIALSTLQE
ncbi:MAG: AAA family ATPase [Armatimonadetes bacterium]|nr:AAA family ATPase [Armatimonadota bacterium]